MTPRTAQGPVANPIAGRLAGGTVGPSTHNLIKDAEERSAIGDAAITADVPTDIAVQDYLPWLESFKPAQALRLYSASSAAHPSERVETAQERRTVFDDTAPELPAVGPDTRYVACAGMVGVEVLRADSDRIVRAHLRDTVGMNMNQGDVPSPPPRECHQTGHDRGTANPQLGN